MQFFALCKKRREKIIVKIPFLDLDSLFYCRFPIQDGQPIPMQIFKAS